MIEEKPEDTEPYWAYDTPFADQISASGHPVSSTILHGFNAGLISNSATYAYANTQFSPCSPVLNVSSGGVTISGDLTVNGVSVVETLNSIQDRLLILRPDPAKLEKFEVLRKAYEHYKLLEKLLHDE